MGKGSVRNITVPLRFVVVTRALAMARLSVGATPLWILPPPSPGSSACTVLPKSSPWLSPYCSSPAGILLLLFGWHPLSPLAPLACLSSAMRTLLLGYAQSLYYPASVAAANTLRLTMQFLARPLSSVRCRPTVSLVFFYARSLSSPSSLRFQALANLCFVVGSLRKGLGLSTCTVV